MEEPILIISIEVATNSNPSNRNDGKSLL